MPKFLGKHQKQFTTIEANETRLITKIRWVIESANGRVKQWRFFNNIIPNTMIEKIGDYFRIVCAMINCYRPVLITNSVNDREIGEKLLKLLHQSNKLKEYVQQLKDTTGKNLKWLSVNAVNSFPTFPKMEFKELQELTLGIYQLKQAHAYTVEHLSSNNTYIVKVANQTPSLLRSQIQSRHKNNICYDVYVQYNNENILGWYCTCPNGSRVVGCCSHVASIIFYFSFARHSRKPLQSRSSSYYNSISDAQDYSDISDDESNDSDDESNILYTLA